MQSTAEKARVAVVEALEELGGTGQRRVIIERARMIGKFTPEEYATPSSQVRYANRVEQKLSWALSDLKREGRLINPERSIWAFSESDAVPLAAPVVRDRLEKLRTMPYRLYLRTPEWRETRRTALVRAGHACELNRSHTERLEVHHSTYERRGQELPQDLVVLCAECHDLFHERFVVPSVPSREPGMSVPPPGLNAAKSAALPSPPHRASLLRRLLAR